MFGRRKLAVLNGILPVGDDDPAVQTVENLVGPLVGPGNGDDGTGPGSGIQKHIPPHDGPPPHLRKFLCEAIEIFQKQPAGIAFAAAVAGGEGIGFVTADVEKSAFTEQLDQLAADRPKKLQSFRIAEAPGPAVGFKKSGQTGVLIQHHVAAVAAAGGAGVPQVVEHGDGFHAHASGIGQDGTDLVLGIGGGPAQFRHAVISQHTPEFKNHMAELEQTGQADDLMQEGQGRLPVSYTHLRDEHMIQQL